MKNKVPQVLISHPGRQHVHQLCYALQINNFPFRFITSIWYKPKALFYKSLDFLPGFIHAKLVKILKKRYFEPLEEKNIRLFLLPELLRQVLQKLSASKNERWTFYSERIHDRYTATTLNRYFPDITIGYEKSSYKTFKRAKELNKITVLDLAAVHYTQNILLRSKYSDYKKMIPDERFFHQINTLKEKEYQFVDYFFVLSEYAKHTLLNAGIEANRIYRLNIGFDPVKFTPKQVYSVNNIFKILVVGRISKLKGIRLILETFKELALLDTRLIFVGAMEDGEDIFRDYKGWYEYIPFVDQQQLIAYYQEAAVFVMPSYTDSWGMAVLEAMACGTPVIISDNTGSKDAVAKGGGFIIPVDDKEALKEKILFFYNNRHQLEKMGIEANQVAQQYTWESYHSQVKQAIDDIWQREQAK